MARKTITKSRKKSVAGFVKLRRKVKIKFLEANMDLFKSDPDKFVELARRKIGYSPKTFHWDIYHSFKKLTA